MAFWGPNFETVVCMEPLEILQTVPQTDLQDILVIVQALAVGFCKGLGDGSKWKYFGEPRHVVIYDICRGVIEGYIRGSVVGIV